MRGFIYTVIVLMLALSFAYLITIQASLQAVESTDYSSFNLRESRNALYGINTHGNTISGNLGRAIHIREYKAIVENYNALRNANFSVDFTPEFKCGNTEMWFDGGVWNTEVKHPTSFEAKLSTGAVGITKNWQWADHGVPLKLKVSSSTDGIIFEEEGYVNETLSNRMEITDENGEMFIITLEDGILSVNGKGIFTQRIDSDCTITNK